MKWGKASEVLAWARSSGHFLRIELYNKLVTTEVSVEPLSHHGHIGPNRGHDRRSTF